jgi:hypothetical protein
MPDLAPNVDATIIRFNQSSWANARDGASGTGIFSTSQRVTNAIRASRTAARGGGTAYHVYRTFFEFDTSGISATPQDATLKIYGFATNVADFFVVKADTATDGALVTADFDAIVGFGLGDNSSNVTKYSSEVTTWSVSGYNNIALNSTALADMRDDDVIKFCLIESTKDLTDTEPTSEISSGMYFQESSGTSFDPILRYTAAATGYANDVIGVSSTNIAKVNGVATANIDKVIGV